MLNNSKLKEIAECAITNFKHGTGKDRRADYNVYQEIIKKITDNDFVNELNAKMDLLTKELNYHSYQD